MHLRDLIPVGLSWLLVTFVQCQLLLLANNSSTCVLIRLYSYKLSREGAIDGIQIDIVRNTSGPSLVRVLLESGLIEQCQITRSKSNCDVEAINKGVEACFRFVRRQVVQSILDRSRGMFAAKNDIEFVANEKSKDHSDYN